MTKKCRFKLRINLALLLLALSLSSCTRDLGEHDVGFREHERITYDDGENHCEHNLVHTFSHGYTAGVAYSTLDYHYTYCTNSEFIEHCKFRPTFERHETVEDTRILHSQVMLYNGRMYEMIPQICAKCKQVARPIYILIEEVEK